LGVRISARRRGYSFRRRGVHLQSLHNGPSVPLLAYRPTKNWGHRRPQRFPSLWPLSAEKLQLLAFQFICCNEEFLDFRTDLLGQITRVFGLLTVRMPRNGNDAIIADRVSASLGLHDFKHADDVALQDKAGGRSQCHGGPAHRQGSPSSPLVDGMKPQSYG